MGPSRRGGGARAAFGAARQARAPTFASPPATTTSPTCRLRGVDPRAVPSLKGPEVLRTLDVTLLHALIIEQILGIDRAAQEKQTNLRYVKDTAQALALAARSGACRRCS